MEEIPDNLIHECLHGLDLESLCSAACVSKTLNLSVSQLLSTRSSLDLSGFSPDSETLKHILYRFKNVKAVTIDCLRLKSSAVVDCIPGPSLQELTLMKGANLGYLIMDSIGRSCHNLRILSLELVGELAPTSLLKLEGLVHLESLSIKLRGSENNALGIVSGWLSFPSTLKVLRLQPMPERVVVQLLQQEFQAGRFHGCSSNMPSLHRLSLVLDFMSDSLITCIITTCPLLVELNLEDKPHKKSGSLDLTNDGFQSLAFLKHLKTLSIIRSRVYHPASFKRITDMGMFLFSAACRRLGSVSLESLCLGGFSTVTDAGFLEILNSCKSLRRFEARNAPRLTVFSLPNMSNVVDSFIELRLLSCSLVTSEVIKQLTPCALLETLDVSGCRSVTDSCFSFLPCFSKLSTLNLGGTDVTDSGLAVLGNGHYTLTQLCLRGCKAVTDKGISRLLDGDGMVGKILTSLDLGCIPGISDDGIAAIASSAPVITELCIRHCYSVTNASVRGLASSRNGFLRMLDLANCCGLTIEVVKFFEKPSFCKLKWLGLGLTSCANQRDAFGAILGERPWLTVCFDGCESGCHDGWHLYHF